MASKSNTAVLDALMCSFPFTVIIIPFFSDISNRIPKRCRPDSEMFFAFGAICSFFIPVTFRPKSPSVMMRQNRMLSPLRCALFPSGNASNG